LPGTYMHAPAVRSVQLQGVCVRMRSSEETTDPLSE